MQLAFLLWCVNYNSANETANSKVKILFNGHVGMQDTQMYGDILLESAYIECVIIFCACASGAFA